jgi:hypothetical protein
MMASHAAVGVSALRQSDTSLVSDANGVPEPKVVYVVVAISLLTRKNTAVLRSRRCEGKRGRRLGGERRFGGEQAALRVGRR